MGIAAREDKAAEEPDRVDMVRCRGWSVVGENAPMVALVETGRVAIDRMEENDGLLP